MTKYHTQSCIFKQDFQFGGALCTNDVIMTSLVPSPKSEIVGGGAQAEKPLSTSPLPGPLDIQSIYAAQYIVLNQNKFATKIIVSEKSVENGNAVSHFYQTSNYPILYTQSHTFAQHIVLIQRFLQHKNCSLDLRLLLDGILDAHQYL